MSDEVIQAALRTWATKDLPARLHATQVAKLLNCSGDDVAILTSAGKLRALGKPRPNAVKLFSTIELITLLADRAWLDDITKTIGQFWRRKNERRKGIDESGGDESEHSTTQKRGEKTSTKPSMVSSTTELNPGGEEVKSGSERVVAKVA